MGDYMILHTYDITVTGPGRSDVRLTQAVQAADMGRAAILACDLVIEAKVAGSATRLVIERRAA